VGLGGTPPVLSRGPPIRLDSFGSEGKGKEGEETEMDKAEAFLDLWRWSCPNLPLPVREFRFSKRRFRFDFAFPDRKVAVEIEGGGWIYGRHHRPKGYEMDLEKYNLAQYLGWKVFRFTPQMLENDPDGCVGMVLGALGWEKGGKGDGARKRRPADGAG
jgi:very-short-patch-repair endonuclease